MKKFGLTNLEAKTIWLSSLNSKKPLVENAFKQANRVALSLAAVKYG